MKNIVFTTCQCVNEPMLHSFSFQGTDMPHYSYTLTQPDVYVASVFPCHTVGRVGALDPGEMLEPQHDPNQILERIIDTRVVEPDAFTNVETLNRKITDNPPIT